MTLKACIVYVRHHLLCVLWSFNNRQFLVAIVGCQSVAITISSEQYTLVSLWEKCSHLWSTELGLEVVNGLHDQPT